MADSKSKSLIPYREITVEALRGVIPRVLRRVADEGLPGEHHFFIEFHTRHEGVELPSHLRAQYPEKMTIVLQNQFSDLLVDDDVFEVRLSFGGVSSLLRVPYAAVTTFADPSVEFALQYEVKLPDRESEGRAAKSAPKAKDAPVKEKPSGTVVQVDFRKK